MDNFLWGVGAWMLLIGIGGMSEAVTDHGSLAVSVIVFAIGFALCFRNYLKEEKKYNRDDYLD